MWWGRRREQGHSFRAPGVRGGGDESGVPREAAQVALRLSGCLFVGVFRLFVCLPSAWMFSLPAVCQRACVRAYLLFVYLFTGLLFLSVFMLAYRLRLSDRFFFSNSLPVFWVSACLSYVFLSTCFSQPCIFFYPPAALSFCRLACLVAVHLPPCAYCNICMYAYVSRKVFIGYRGRPARTSSGRGKRVGEEQHARTVTGTGGFFFLSFFFSPPFLWQ